MKDVYESFLCYYHIKERLNEVSQKNADKYEEYFKSDVNVNMFVDLNGVYSDFVCEEIKEKTKQDLNVLFCGEDALYGIKSKIYEKFMLHLDVIINQFKKEKMVKTNGKHTGKAE